ncbi:MAG: diguanylate cyclase [Candidatus Cloacimonadota bacterium]|nr:diguanylate cyclase [Candidatus Cloacimonadota bacterium]
MNYLNKLGILLSELQQHNNLEENLSKIIRTIKSDIEFQSLGIYLKKQNLYRLKITRNVSHSFEKKSYFTTEDELIKKIKNLKPLILSENGKFKFEKNYSHLVILPLHNNHELLGFMFVDKLEGKFNELEYTLLQIHSFIISLGISFQQQRDQIESMRETDSITGMYNYKYFCHRAQYIFKLLQKTNSTLSAAALKVNNYDIILRTFGLKAIQQTACKVNDIIRKNISELDIIGRIYNDTIAIVFPATTVEECERKIKQINSQLQKINNLSIVKLGWGIASNDRINNIEQLIRHAEQAAFESTRKNNTSITK